MAQYEVNGQVYDFPDDMPPEVALSIISVANPKAFEETPTTGNPELDSTITQGNMMENSAEYQSPFVGTPMGIRPASQDQMLDTLGVPKDAPVVEPAPVQEAAPTQPQLDPTKPYGGLFAPVEPVYEDVTDDVNTDPLGNPLATTYQQTSTVEKKIAPSELPQRPDWMNASSMVYEALNDKPFTGNPEELADYGVQVAQFFGNNLTLGSIPLAIQVSQMPEDKRQAFLYLLETYERVGLTAGNAARAVGYQVTDPTNIISVGAILASLGASTPVVQAGKLATVETLKAIIKNPAFIAGLDTALSGAGFDLSRQSVEKSAGARESIDLGQTAEVAGISGAVGAGLGGLAGVIGKNIAREAPDVVRPKVDMPKVEPDFIPQPQLTPELEDAVSTFEKGLKEELAKESLGPEFTDVVTTPGDNVDNALVGAETLDEKAQKIVNNMAPSHFDAAANDNQASIVAANTDRIDSLKDQINGVDSKQREAINQNNPPQPKVSDGVRELLDRVPDFEEYSMDYVRKAIKPVMDEFLEIAKQGPEELDRAISYKLITPDRTKLMSIVTSAASRTERAVRDVTDEIDALVQAKTTDAYKIEFLEQKKSELLDQLANIQVLQTPVNREAGRLLKLAQIENALNADNRVDVAKLRALGVSDEDIALKIADASDSVSKKELYALYRERDDAMMRQDVEEMRKIDDKIDGVLEKLKEATEVAKDSVLKKAVGVIVEMRTTSLISSTGTLTRNLVGGGLHKIMDRSAEIIGLLREKGVSEGYEYIAAQRVGRGIALKAGYQSQLEALGNLFAQSVKEAANERSLLDMGDYGDRNIRKISSTALGIDPNTKTGKAVDIAGRVWRAQGIPMLISDEIMGGIFARAEIGEQAGFEFVQLLAKKRQVLEAKLRDPNLKPKTKAKYEEQLAELKDVKTARIRQVRQTPDGPEVRMESLADYIEVKVSGAIDKSGRITDEAVRERVNYLLLRNKPTGKISKGIEYGANIYNGAPRLLQSFVRTPINEFKRTLEYMPLTYHFKGMHDLGTDLASKDPRVVARAKGKFYLGWAIASTAVFAGIYGITSPSAPRNKDDRLTNEASSEMAPKSINLFGVPFDGSGTGMLANIMTFGANLTRDVEMAWRKVDQEIAIGNKEGAAKQIEFAEELERKGKIVLYAYMAGIANATLDTQALEAPNAFVNAMITVTKSSDDNEVLSKALEKQGQRYVTSFPPSILKEFANVIDPTKVDPDGSIEALKASMGFKDSQAIVRDILGDPIEVKTPYRALIGPFGPQNIKPEDNLRQKVKNDLEYIREMTGRSFILDTMTPEVRQIDLTKWPSKVSGRTIYDTYGENIRTIKLAGTGGKSQTLVEAMDELIGDREMLNLSLGNDQEKGSFFKYMDKVIQRYKTAAWMKTKEDEKGNKAFAQEFNWRFDLKEAAGDSQYDIAPPRIQRFMQ